MEAFKRGWFSGRSSYNTATTSVAMLPSTTDLEALGETWPLMNSLGGNQREGPTVFNQHIDADQRLGKKTDRHDCDQLPILFGVMGHGWKIWCRRGDLNPHVG